MLQLWTDRSLPKGLFISRWNYFSVSVWSTTIEASTDTVTSAAAVSSATVTPAHTVLPAEPPTPDLPAGSGSSSLGYCRSGTGRLWRRIRRKGEGEMSRLCYDLTPASDRTTGGPDD